MLKTFLNWQASLPAGKRELFRFCICLIASFIFSIILAFGLDGQGNVEGWADTPVALFTSTRVVSLTLYFLIPSFLYTLIKGYILQANKEFKLVLNMVAVQITGVIYCFGCIAMTLSFFLYKLHNQEFLIMLIGGLMFCGFGFMMFYVFQGLIQGTFEPKVWEKD